MKLRHMLIGGLLGFLVGAVPLVTLFIHFALKIHKFFLHQLGSIDIVGFIICRGGCQGLFGFPYIFTIPISLTVYGFFGGMLYSINRRVKE